MNNYLVNTLFSCLALLRLSMGPVAGDPWLPLRLLLSIHYNTLLPITIHYHPLPSIPIPFLHPSCGGAWVPEGWAINGRALGFGTDLVWISSLGFWEGYLPGRGRGLVLSSPPLLYSAESGFFQPFGGISCGVSPALSGR